MTAGDRREPRVPIELVTATALLVVGLLYGAQALQEGLGSVADSGPGAFPFAVAVVLVGASALVIVQERGRSRTPASAAEDEDVVGEVRWGRIAGVLAAALAVPAFGEVLGFVVTLSIALTVIAKVMGMSTWWKPVVFGALFGAAVWLVFVHWLYVPLPPGRLGLA